jgi:hypothetical protein
MGVSGVIHSNPPVTYFINDFLLTGDPKYTGKSAGGNTWLVQKFSTVSGTMLYATQANNPTVTTYVDAWANKLTLNYGQYQDI